MVQKTVMQMTVYGFTNFYFKILPVFLDCSNATWIHRMILNIKLTSTFGFIVFIFKIYHKPTFNVKKAIKHEAMQDYIFSHCANHNSSRPVTTRCTPKILPFISFICTV